MRHGLGRSDLGRHGFGRRKHRGWRRGWRRGRHELERHIDQLHGHQFGVDEHRGVTGAARRRHHDSSMTLWNRVRRVLGIRSESDAYAVEDDRIVLRDLAKARTFPQEPKESGKRHIDACERCQLRLRQVVFTTAGTGEAQAAIWRAHPVALDGWVCVRCGWAAYSRFITVEESVEFGRTAAGHAEACRFDDAEFWWRRLLSSWPGYPPAYADLGQLSLARSDRIKDPEEKRTLIVAAATWLRRAAEADPERRIGAIHVRFGSTLAVAGEEDEALSVLDSVATDTRVPDATRDAARERAIEVRVGKALFRRATALLANKHLDPPGMAIEPVDRRRIDAARSLLEEAEAREGTTPSFATKWVLGKIALRVGDTDAAIHRLEAAHAIDPKQPNGCRELGAAYMDAGRHADAVRIAERAVELDPDDAGLLANLALAQLLANKPKRATATANRALELDPDDEITRTLVRIIDDVRSGRREQPRSLAELEGRKSRAR